MFRIRTLQISFFIVFTLALLDVKGQEVIRFQNLGVDDGLSMGTITSVQKDDQGYVWVATAEGLHRFDGKSFKIFKHLEGSENSLADSYIRCIKTIGDYIYVGNNQGTLDRLNLHDYTVKNFNPRSIDKSFDYTINVIERFEDVLLLGTEGGGLWLYSLKDEGILKYQASGHELSEISDIKVKGSKFYISSSDQIYNCDLKSCKLELKWDLGQITAIEFRGNELIIGGPKGVQRRVGNDLLDVELPKRKRRIKEITDIKSDGSVLWIATHGGLVRMDRGYTDHYVHNPIRPFSIVNDQVNNLFIDDEGILWVGTITGLSRYAPRLKKFGLLQYFDFASQGSNNNVYYVYNSPDDNIWLGTLTGGLVKLNKNHKIVDVFPILKDGDAETRSVRCMFEDSKGNFWIGTRDEGLFLFNESARTFKHIKGEEGAQLPNIVIRAIHEDSKGRLWIGTQAGLSLYDQKTNTFKNYKAEPNSKTNNTIYQITEDPTNGHLILASFRGGLQWFNPRSKHFLSLKYNDNDSTSISNNRVMCMEWINSDTLLIGTYGGGMDILDIRTKQAAHVNEGNGLVNNAVYGILYQGQGKTWLSTNNGLVQYDIYNHKFIDFKPVHYLQNSEYNEGAFARSNSGYFYFGGVSGLNYFRPNSIAYDTISPPLMITDIRGAYKDARNKSIEMSFINSRLELDFMALYFVNPEGVKYKYMMEGYDQNWVEPRLSNTAIYPRLNPGSYTFKVVAEDEFGQWSSKPIELEVYIIPPFWQRWWFIGLLVILLGGGIYGLFRFRTREIERSYKLQLVDSELSALRSQMNPHFIFNSLNSIQYFILKKQPREAYTYLSKFASLMRKILQNSRLKYISINDEAEWLDLYLEMERLRMDNNLNFVIDYSDIDDVDNTYIPTMLIQPYVENSIIHGLLSKEDDRNILIKFTEEQDHVVCSVEDNGIGRIASRELNEKRTRKHDSAGMALTKSRLKILSEGKGDFDVKIDDLYENDTATGTKVTILIPLIEKVND